MVYTKVSFWLGSSMGKGVGAGRCSVLVIQHHGRKHGVHKGEIMAGAYNGGGG